MERAVFEIKQNPVGYYYFTFKDLGGETQVISCNFQNRSILEKCIAKIRDAAPLSDIHSNTDLFEKPPFFMIDTRHDGVIFSLVGFSKEIIFSSVSYPNEYFCKEAIKAFKLTANNAAVIDLTTN